jgi:hypothetical protein
VLPLVFTEQKPPLLPVEMLNFFPSPQATVMAACVWGGAAFLLPAGKNDELSPNCRSQYNSRCPVQ